MGLGGGARLMEVRNAIDWLIGLCAYSWAMTRLRSLVCGGCCLLRWC